MILIYSDPSDINTISPQHVTKGHKMPPISPKSPHGFRGSSSITSSSQARSLVVRGEGRGCRGGVGGGNRQEGALTIEQLQQQVYAKNGDNHVYICLYIIIS